MLTTQSSAGAVSISLTSLERDNVFNNRRCSCTALWTDVSLDCTYTVTYTYSEEWCHRWSGRLAIHVEYGLNRMSTETGQTSLYSASYVSWQCGTARSAAARLLLSAGQQSISISCSPGLQQQTRSSGVRQANWTNKHHITTYYAGSANKEIHTHPFNGPLSGTTQVSRYQKGKTNVDFTEARDCEWQWYQLGHMQVCT